MKWTEELRRILQRLRGEIPTEQAPGDIDCHEALERIFDWLDSELDPTEAASVAPTPSSTPTPAPESVSEAAPTTEAPSAADGGGCTAITGTRPAGVELSMMLLLLLPAGLAGWRRRRGAVKRP